MKILLTGANGFVGSYVADRLLQSGLDVRCLVRSASNKQWLTGKKIELVEFDGSWNEGIAKQAVRDTELVIHVAGTLVARNDIEYEKINVEPARVLLDVCCHKPQLRRFVLVSSLGAAGPNEKLDGLLSESDPCRPVSAYGRSKLKAEELTRTYAGRVPFTIVRPSAVYGPRDTNMLRLFRSARMSAKIHQIGPGPKSLSLAHARDIAEGIYQAALSPKSVNEMYFLASEKPHSLDDLKSALEACVERRLRVVHVPNLVVQGMMLYADFVTKCWGKDILLNRDRLETLSYRRWDCDVSKAQRDFGYQPSTTLSDGFRETYEWYREQAWL